MIKDLDYVIGIDNGASGTIGIVNDSGCFYFEHTPVKKELSYTKSKNWITRVDGVTLLNILSPFSLCNSFIYLERPFVNPQMFKASMSAIRALEATLIVIEQLQIPYEYIDSKQWQSEILPKDIQGREELKKASLQIGKRLFPKFEQSKFKDFDGLLIAEWGWRKNKGGV